MIHAGIDIGSRTIKLAVIENGSIIELKKLYNSYNPLETCREILSGVKFDTLTATGYGRHMIKNYMNCDVVSEIKAFAVGARTVNDSCRTVLDIGGQDTKAISLDENGRLNRFEMNDKCAAGTGRFLEIMAAALGYGYEDFSSDALTAEKAESINNTCTVFAESEVISLVTQGVPRNEISLGIHKSIAQRAVNLLKRVSVEKDILFAGGVALNRCMTELIEKELGCRIIIPDEPQMVGAIGCAFLNE
ncbi:MAG: 3-hydroxyacyl-ACP dehydratase [Spirochaetae bacterium HGW-Spirochaetae-5]|nr:MAG: 3-hydroxyacyl-ACP dehydratase [Spirochaetae bacterium HGW-Spirochaetae-5]